MVGLGLSQCLPKLCSSGFAEPPLLEGLRDQRSGDYFARCRETAFRTFGGPTVVLISPALFAASLFTQPFPLHLLLRPGYERISRSLHAPRQEPPAKEPDPIFTLASLQMARVYSTPTL